MDTSVYREWRELVDALFGPPRHQAVDTPLCRVYRDVVDAWFGRAPRHATFTAHTTVKRLRGGGTWDISWVKGCHLVLGIESDAATRVHLSLDRWTPEGLDPLSLTPCIRRFPVNDTFFLAVPNPAPVTLRVDAACRLRLLYGTLATGPLRTPAVQYTLLGPSRGLFLWDGGYASIRAERGLREHMTQHGWNGVEGVPFRRCGPPRDSVVQPSTRRMVEEASAATVQRVWRKAVVCPEREVCRRRLLREFGALPGSALMRAGRAPVAAGSWAVRLRRVLRYAHDAAVCCWRVTVSQCPKFPTRLLLPELYPISIRPSWRMKKPV